MHDTTKVSPLWFGSSRVSFPHIDVAYLANVCMQSKKDRKPMHTGPEEWRQ